MAIDWTWYEAFDWASSSQRPLDEAGRALVEDFAAGVLAVPPECLAGRAWARASPPGRYAATILRVEPGTPHRFGAALHALGGAALAFKVLKTTPDASSLGPRLVELHTHQLPRLPGLPNSHVQRSLAAGISRDGQGNERCWITQEWVTGRTLEELRGRWREEPLAGALASSLLEQLFGRIILPLWSVGLIWWDVRDANYCLDPESGKLTLIDVDSLAAYAGEVLDTPARWEGREKGRETALGRLRAMTLRLLRAQGAARGSRGEKALTSAWEETLAPTLKRLGRGDVPEEQARDALASFLGRLRQEGLLLGKAGYPA